MLSAPIDLAHPDGYVHWGAVLISVANLVVIVVMLALFVAALLLPFVRVRPASPEVEDPAPPVRVGSGSGSGSDGNWTGGVRRFALRTLPPGKLLPDAQPSYVASWVYVFGVLTVAALVVVVASGLVLAIFGPSWWHTSFVGHFVNSLHLWGVELFMGFMVIHLWAKFWMAAWRGGRSSTWMTGVVCFLVAIIEAFTGYLSQTNFDAQWIAFEAKDGLNSGGIGAYFNTLNFGQALMVHIALLPLVLIAIVAVHVLLVRVHGVVPPIDALPAHLGVAPPTRAPEVATASTGIETSPSSPPSPELVGARASAPTGQVRR